MFLIPLNQLESVELVIHALKMAAGQADCSTCPARKVCMKQCATIAAAVEEMAHNGSLPHLAEPSLQNEHGETGETAVPRDDPPKPGKLKLVK